VATDKKTEKAIFDAALRFKSREERDAYVSETCGDDERLLAGVWALLQYHEKGSFLDAPILEPAITWDDSPISESPGTVIDKYRLLEKIGEGGMAVVYMAEQEQPIRRKVALKIIKLGMDTKQVIARFEAERQALALMDHLCIAKVLDAGATETGRPYFVMELVTGVSITDYCDKNNLGTKDRLALFIQVCNAIQHAHEKGVVHRDIKPSNVMVAHHDGKPVPKVIDFGIAKATNQRLTEKTLFTRYAHIIGTPAYMSPEQAELSDLGIDSRSDIYSLGVLLYELLTGTTPFSKEELRKAGYVEMQRIIREEEPAKPSVKLSTLGETLADIAERRGYTPDLLTKTVRGDLDLIVMKTLEKDRTRRYEGAVELANDVERHLNCEPVQAAPPSTIYRLRKFVRRNRVAVITVSLVAAALAVGAVTTTLTFMTADRLAGMVEQSGAKVNGPDGKPEATIRKIWGARGTEKELQDVNTALYWLTWSGDSRPAPNGRYVAYTNWGPANIGVYDLSTGESRDITDEGTWDVPPTGDEFGYHPIWSPDSRYVAYEWCISGASVDNLKDHRELRIVGLDGTEPRVIYRTDNFEEEINPYDWSPDGRTILASIEHGKNRSPFHIVLISVEDGSKRILKSFEQDLRRDTSGEDNLMFFSPDGHYIAYDLDLSREYPKRDIFLLKTDGSGDSIPLVTHPADDQLLGWLPDGKRLLFATNRTGVKTMALIDVHEGTSQGVPQVVRRLEVGFQPMGLTRNGTYYYSSKKDVRDVYTATLDLETGKVVVPPALIKASMEGFASAPCWSSDGQYLAYLSKKRSDSMKSLPSYEYDTVTILSVKGHEVREVTPPGPNQINVVSNLILVP